MPGAIVLHRIEDDGSAGEALACCATCAAGRRASSGACSVETELDPAWLPPPRANAPFESRVVSRVAWAMGGCSCACGVAMCVRIIFGLR